MIKWSCTFITSNIDELSSKDGILIGVRTASFKCFKTEVRNLKKSELLWYRPQAANQLAVYQNLH